MSSYFINQTLIDTHCSTDSKGITKCVSQLSTLDLSHQPYHREYVLPSTKTLLKFPICNGEVNSVNKILSIFPHFSVSNFEPKDQSNSSTSHDSSM